MTLASARRRYVTDAVSTVNPHQLVVMLYDRLLLDITRAGDALQTRNYEVVNEQLTHAQDIVLELQGSLNPDVWSGGPGLMQLYTWLMSELVGANVAKDPARVEACRAVVEPLAQAWRAAATQLADEAQPQVQPGGLVG